MYETNRSEKEGKLPQGVMLYPSFYEALKDLPEEVVGRLILALLRYVRCGEEPDFDPALKVAWSFLKHYADEDRRRYAEAVLRRRSAAEKRWRGRGSGESTPPQQEPELKPTGKKAAEKKPVEKKPPTEKKPADAPPRELPPIVRYLPPEKPGDPPVALRPLTEEEAGPPVSYQWVRDNILTGENAKFLEPLVKKAFF